MTFDPWWPCVCGDFHSGRPHIIHNEHGDPIHEPVNY